MWTVEINENRETTEGKIKRTKIWSIGWINNTKKSLARLRKKREKTQISKSRMKEGTSLQFHRHYRNKETSHTHTHTHTQNTLCPYIQTLV
jgi:hypothetical protein